jgi:hypothetical protein
MEKLKRGITMKRWYIGHNNGHIAFQSDFEPTPTSHGELYCAVIGPFKTKRAAMWAEKYGYMNPHFRHVDDAEWLSRIA